MSSYTSFRSSTGELPRGGFEEGRRPAAERWDRDRFERMRRGPVPEEREHIHYEERDRPGREEVRINISDVRKESRPRVAEREREREPVYSPTRRPERDIFYEPTPSEVANRALAPYRRKSVVERDIMVPPKIRRPARPQMLRRQSSLDTFDRRPVHRYGDEYRLPADVPIPLPIRRDSPPRRRYRESEFEEIKYRDGHGSDFEEEYRETRIKREGKRHRRRRQSHAPSTRASSSSSSRSMTTEVSPVRLPGKKGKTRMPKRLAHQKAISDLGYPYEEEQDFFIVKRALGKEHIDEIIEMSKTIREEGPEHQVYVYDSHETKTSTSVPAPPSIAESAHHSHHDLHDNHDHHDDHHDFHDHHNHPEEYKKTTIEYQFPPGSMPPGFMPPGSMPPGPMPPGPMHHGPMSHGPPPPPASIRNVSPARSVKSTATHHTRRRSPSPSARSHMSRQEFVERVEMREESNPIHGPLTIVAPPRHHHRDHELQREITALESERRALRLEREADDRRALAERIRVGEHDSYEVVELRDQHHHQPREREVVRVEKDRRGRSKSKPPNPKLVGLAMATLS